jgi:hypothetical protein
MKKVFSCLLLALFSIALHADPIECMTKTEAESLAKYLRTVGFVYEYCDCCNDQSVVLMSVNEVIVEECNYDAERWEVKIKGEKVHVFGGTDKLNLIQPNDGHREEYEFVASLNYTYVFSGEGALAIPLGFATKTWNDNACIGKLNIPAPKDYTIEDKEYIKWYKKNVK